MANVELLIEIGTILMVAFIGATIATKLKQSVILGYIIAGALIGPYIYIEIGPIVYNGVVHETGLIDLFSQLGLILLIFFVGLEFSIDKIKRVKGPAVVLSLIDVGLNLFTGFLLAAWLGWGLVDSIFLAAVLSMSCSAVAMKTLVELGRLEKPETEFMLGMIILEEFISMLFLTLVGGLLIKGDATFSPTNMIVGMVAFFVFFAVMAAVVIPYVIKRLDKMKSDEMFVLFMLGIIALTAAIAEYCGVPSLIGAFFIGITFAETRITKRLERKIAPLRDAFVAIFFVSFGMFIDPSMFGAVWSIIIIAVVIILLDEIVIMSIVAYLVGFPRREAVSIGSSFSARGGESVMYATVGSKAATATKGAELYPIAGAITFVMSVLCPYFIKKSYEIADRMAIRVPRYIAYGGSIFSRTMGKMILPGGLRLFKTSKGLPISLSLYLMSIISILSLTGELRLAAFMISLGACAVAWFALRSEIDKVVRKIDYSNLGTIYGNAGKISHYIASVISLSMIMCVTDAFVMVVYWPSVIIISVAYVSWFIYLMKMVHHHTCDDSVKMPEFRRVPAEETAEPGNPVYKHRERWKGFEDDEQH
ncbi:MAG TPA: cation:proton antiporter [Methanomassiliicoccales archaeon]|jgi:CPA2 family monovalent cation:H+ antiporter-2